MTADPHQTDLHAQDAPDFIGPRLPKDHPAYRPRPARAPADAVPPLPPIPVIAPEGDRS